MKFERSSYPPRACIGCLAFLTVLAPMLLGACEKQTVSAPIIRPVRSVVLEKHAVGDAVVLTGQLRARDEVSLAFRLSGKLIARSANVGDIVKAGQLVARLDDQIQRDARTAAQADLAAAQAALDQSAAFERRQDELLRQGVSSRNDYDLAVRQLKTAKAQVNAARAKLSSAEEQLGYTDLISDATGVVTEKGAEPGEVVQAGQMILMVARQSGRDAVISVPAQVIRDGVSAKNEVDVWLADNPSIKTTGRIREISPQADPATRNYQVKVALDNPPSTMFLGATVVGRLKLHAESLIEVPSPALTMQDNKPAVWVIDPKDKRVHRRIVKIARYTPDSVIVTDGLHAGERIVTAGVQELHEGQEVKLLGDPS